MAICALFVMQKLEKWSASLLSMFICYSSRFKGMHLHVSCSGLGSEVIKGLAWLAVSNLNKVKIIVLDQRYDSKA